LDTYRISELLDKEEKLQKILLSESSNKKNLIDNINRRFTTSIIGALDSIQKDLGNLWGDNKPYKELNENQKAWREVWIDLRKTILDKGHSQARAAIADIESFDTSLKYRYVFGLKNETNN